MKIRLSDKELQQSYSLLDTKEINMSIADLLFPAYEETDFFVGVKSPSELYSKLIEYWDVPEEEIEILDKWVKPSIHQLNKDFFDDIPYYKSINPKPFKDGDYKLEYISYKAFQPFSLNDIEVDNKDFYLERSPIAYFDEEVKYLALTHKDTVWMSITPNEINTMSSYIKEAKGNVLVLGLGLGYYPFSISLKDEVNKITIIELDQNIINIFNKHLLPLFPHKEKINIVKGDAIKFLNNNKDHYDYVFVDLWHNPDDGLPLYLKISKIAMHYKNTKFQYWLEKSLIALYRRCLLTIFEESLNGYDDKAYAAVVQPLDKVINDIYFKTKNITINSYDDIHKLLSDESIIKLIKS